MEPHEKIRVALESIPEWSGLEASAFHVAPLKGGLTNILSIVKRKGEEEEKTTTATATGSPEKRAKREPSARDPEGFPIALVREYGRGSEAFMKREQEQKIVECLSKSGISPRVYRSFPWGRVEEYLPHSRTLTTKEFGSLAFVPKVGELLGKFHHPDVARELIELCVDDMEQDVGRRGMSVLGSRLRKWHRLALGTHFPEDRVKQRKLDCLDVGGLAEHVNWLLEVALPSARGESGKEGGSSLVFCHCDLQEGNILLPSRAGAALRMIDFEYCDRMERGFDLGNCFCEMAICYAIENFPGFVLNPDDYPSPPIQWAFCEAYARAAGLISSTSSTTAASREKDTAMIHQLMREGRVFSLASHLHWVLWSVIMAQSTTIEWGYLEFAQQRLDQFLVGRARFERTGGEPWPSAFVPSPSFTSALASNSSSVGEDGGYWHP